MVDREPVHGVQRRVAGNHDVRLDGISDLLLRARGASVLDLGCNRGMVGFEFAYNGARLVHGCDNYAKGVETAREVFADLRFVAAQFEVVNLAEGVAALKPFKEPTYDVVLCLATIHKLSRIMQRSELEKLVLHLGTRTAKYLGWRSTERNKEDNDLEWKMLDKLLGEAGLVNVQYSELSDLGPAAIWERK